MEFKTLTADAMAEVQAITFRSGLRNCNFTFANLVGWQFWFHFNVVLVHKLNTVL